VKSSAATSARTSSSAAAARARDALPPEARAAANDEPRPDDQRIKEPPGPLWVIAIGMAVFFGATALLMMFD
jgi:hypothetical protein